MRVRSIFPLALLALFGALPAPADRGPQSPSRQQAEPPPAAPARREPSTATITFRKIFKSSTPEFVEIRINRRGESTYDIRQLDDPPSPESFPVSPALAEKIFALSAELRDFNGVTLDLPRRVANLGEK